jgi:transcriptional regulator with XRE-family HTH domain
MTNTPREDESSIAGRMREKKPSKELGARLRSARERQGVSLRGLARYAGVSPSLVSQIERGGVMPSVGTLFTIATELGLVIDDLFQDKQTQTGAGISRRESDSATGDTNNPIVAPHRRKVIRLAGGVRWEQLTPTSDAQVEFRLVVYEVGAASCPEDSLIRHSGKEYAYIVSGHLGLKLGFEDFELSPGDSVSFDAHVPHRLWGLGDEPAVAIWVLLNPHADNRAPAPES